MTKEQPSLFASPHLETIAQALKALRGWLPEPQNGAGSVEYDRAIVEVRRKHNAATTSVTELDALIRAFLKAMDE